MATNTSRCSMVSHTFDDSITGLKVSCDEVCNYRHPERSPVDCFEKCPDLDACLRSQVPTDPPVAEAVVVVVDLSTPSTVSMVTEGADCRQGLHLVDHVAYVTIIGVLAVVVIILGAFVYRYKRQLSRRRAGGTTPRSTEMMDPESGKSLNLVDQDQFRMPLQPSDSCENKLMSSYSPGKRINGFSQTDCFYSHQEGTGHYGNSNTSVASIHSNRGSYSNVVANGGLHSG